MAWTQRDKYPSERLLSLAEMASDLEIDPQIPIRRYYRSGSEMLKMGEIYYKEDKLESAYILFFKYVSLHIDKIKHHPDYKDVLRLLPEEKKKVNGQVKVILLELEKIKAELRKIYEAEHQEWLKDMVNKWRSGGEVKQESGGEEEKGTGKEVKKESGGEEETKSEGEKEEEKEMEGDEEKESGGEEKKEMEGEEEKEIEGDEEKESGGEVEKEMKGEEEKEIEGDKEKESGGEEEKGFKGEPSQIPKLGVNRQVDSSVFKHLSFLDLKKWFRVNQRDGESVGK